MKKLLAGMAIFYAASVAAIEPQLEVGQVYRQYSDESSPGTDWKFTAGVKKFPLYAFYDSQSPEIRLLGQDLGYTDMQTFGLGARFDITKKVSIFVEVGYSDPDADVLYSTQQEVVYTHLLRHNVHGRPVPVNGPFHEPYGYESEYTLDDGYSAGVGIGIQLCGWAKITAGYRRLRLDEYMSIYDAEKRAAGRGYWEERSVRDFDSFGVGFFLTY